MDQDPEQRVAELEGQLADQQPVVRFLASAAPGSNRRQVGFIFGMLAASMLVFVAVRAVVPRNIYEIAGMPISIGIWVIAGCVLCFGFPDLVGRTRRRKVVICVTGDELTVNARRGKVLSFGDAQLGPWDFHGCGMAAGTALHLRRDAQTFVLGGRDHRVGARTRCEAAPTAGIQAWMWAADFDSLLATIGPRYGWDVRGPEPGQPTRCLLIPKSADWFAPIASPSLAIDVGEDAISVIHLNNSAPAVSAPLDQVKALPEQYVFIGSRNGRILRAQLVLRIPGVQTLSIGCPAGRGLWWGNILYKRHDRFSWRGDRLDSQEPPAHWVSAADWLTLVETFGLTQELEDKARR